MSNVCKAVGCFNIAVAPGADYCTECGKVEMGFHHHAAEKTASSLPHLILPTAPQESMSQRYPKYYKPVGDLKEVDVYAVHMLFEIDDPSGAIQHASKKLLLSGCRTGGKSAFDDVREARDTLNRWLELNSPPIPTINN